MSGHRENHISRVSLTCENRVREKNSRMDSGVFWGGSGAKATQLEARTDEGWLGSKQGGVFTWTNATKLDKSFQVLRIASSTALAWCKNYMNRTLSRCWTVLFWQPLANIFKELSGNDEREGVTKGTQNVHQSATLNIKWYVWIHVYACDDRIFPYIYLYKVQTQSFGQGRVTLRQVGAPWAP